MSSHAPRDAESEDPALDAPRIAQPESLAELLGGRRAALEASAPPVGFLIGWLATGQNLAWACGAALLVSAAIAVVAFVQRRAPRAVVLSLLIVAIGALIVAYTGDARDLFLPRLLTNAASALAWAASIAIRWPLLGVIVGVAVGTRSRWRRDPALVRAYSRASWFWVLQYVIRTVVFGGLYMAGQVEALAIAQVVLTYPLVIACIAVSGMVLFRSIPSGHPGIRHPQVG